MELEKVEQVAFTGLKKILWDVVITVSGYEARASFLAEHLRISGEKKLVLAYEELKEKLHRPDNDRKYLNLGYEFIMVSESSTSEIEMLMDRLFTGSRMPVNILIDYSCMQKEWYAKILQYLLLHDLSKKPLYVYFSYTPSTFSKPQKRGRTLFGRKYPPLSYMVKDKKPLALVLGLGFEQSAIQHVYDQARDSEIWLCYADPAYDPRFINELETRYSRLISATQDSHIVRYPLQDFPSTFHALISLILDLRLHHTVVLVPFGPKPFFLASLMVAARYPDIQIWFPDYVQDQYIYDWKPFAEPQVCCATFVED